MDLHSELARLLTSIAEAPPSGATGGLKKNYTEKVSRRLAPLISAELQELGLHQVQAPDGRDR